MTKERQTDVDTDAGTDTDTDTGTDAGTDTGIRRRTARDGQRSEWVLIASTPVASRPLVAQSRNTAAGRRRARRVPSLLIS
jgi:hypothetical protein